MVGAASFEALYYRHHPYWSYLFQVTLPSLF